MRALIAVNGTVIPERSIAEIWHIGEGVSRVYVSGTIAATGHQISDICTFQEDVTGTPIQLAELLGWEIVNKQSKDG